MTRRIVQAAAVAALAALALSGCGAEGPSAPQAGLGQVWVGQVQMPDGRVVDCIATARGLSCDWQGADS